MSKVKDLCYEAIFGVGGSLELINHYLNELHNVDSNDVVEACILLLQHKKAYFEDKKVIGDFEKLQKDAILAYSKSK